MRELRRTRQSLAAAWIAVVLVIGGALMLYPIGTPILNCLFVVVKVCMVSGLLVYIFSGNPRAGVFLWTIASVAAVAMTAIKWSLTASPSAWDIVHYLGSMVVDLGMPTLVYRLS